MKKILIIFAFITCILPFINNMEVQSRPCNPAIEICSVNDPGGGGDDTLNCLENVTNSTGIDMDSTIECTMKPSESNSIDTFIIQIEDGVDIVIKGISDESIIANLYKGLQTTTVYKTFQITPNQSPIPELQSSIYDFHYEYFDSSDYGFYFETSGDSNDYYTLEIINDNATTEFNYEVVVSDFCDCVKSDFYYYNDKATPMGIQTAIDYVNMELEYNIDITFPGEFHEMMELVLEDFNEMDLVDMTSVFTFNSGIDLFITDVYNADTGASAGWYSYHGTSFDTITINTAKFGSNYDHRFYKTFAHEVSHAFGLNMDKRMGWDETTQSFPLNHKWDQYTSNSYTTWESYHLGYNSSLNWDTIVDSEDLHNVSHQSGGEAYGLGECNKSVLRDLWGG